MSPNNLKDWLSGQIMSRGATSPMNMGTDRLAIDLINGGELLRQ
jgi:hypothetical protein